MYRAEFDSLTTDNSTFQCYYTYKRFFEQCTRGGVMHFDESCLGLVSAVDVCKRDLGIRMPNYTPAMMKNVVY